MPVVDVVPLAEPELGRGHPQKVAYLLEYENGDCSLKMEFPVFLLFCSGPRHFV
jgi:hypothetical protein